jgi:hypothetical protein
VEQVGSAIEFRFTLPNEAVGGEDLTKPLEIELSRSTVPGPQTSTRGEPGQSWISLKPGDLAPDAQGKVRYAAQLSVDEFGRSIGKAFHFEVRTLTRGFRGRPIESDPSNAAPLSLLDVPQPVTGLRVEATQDALDLQWSAPSETMTGKAAGPISSYRVYRSERDSARRAQATPDQMVADVHEPTYADANFEFGQTYSYKVRAVVTVNGVKAESQDSAPLEILPRDTFPPAIPAGLAGLYTSGAIDLIWNPNQERDLAGYNIMRREDGRRPERLNLELLRSPLYHDTAVAPGHHYYYQARAVDMSGNESAPSAEIEVDVP